MLQLSNKVFSFGFPQNKCIVGSQMSLQFCLMFSLISHVCTETWGIFKAVDTPEQMLLTIFSS